MKRIVQTAIVAMGLLTIPLLPAEMAPSGGEQQQIIAVIKEIQAQQATIAENQAKIDEKLAEVSELIRTARILAGKVGK